MCFILSSFNRKDGSVLSCFSGFETSRKCHASTDDASTHKGSVGYQPRYASALNFVVNDMESCSVSHKLVLKIFARSLSTYGVITQLGECLPCKQEVEGSNPFGSTSTDSKPFFCIKKNVQYVRITQLGRVPALQAGSRGFDPLSGHHLTRRRGYLGQGIFIP